MTALDNDVHFGCAPWYSFWSSLCTFRGILLILEFVGQMSYFSEVDFFINKIVVVSKELKSYDVLYEKYL